MSDWRLAARGGAGNDLYRTHRDVAASGRAMAFTGQQVGDRCVGDTLSSQLQQPGLHSGAAGEGMEGMHRGLDLQLGDLTTPPDNTHSDAVRRQAVQHDLVDQAAQQGLLMRPVAPGCRQRVGSCGPRARKSSRSSDVSTSGKARAARRWASRCLGPAELTQRHLPPMLQLCRDQAIVRIDPGGLPLRQEGLVAGGSTCCTSARSRASSACRPAALVTLAAA